LKPGAFSSYGLTEYQLVQPRRSLPLGAQRVFGGDALLVLDVELGAPLVQGGALGGELALQAAVQVKNVKKQNVVIARISLHRLKG
jgi:hypothetical protein